MILCLYFKISDKKWQLFSLMTLQNAVEGYENQNKFLNQEILELNRLRRDDEAREQQLVLYVSSQH